MKLVKKKKNGHNLQSQDQCRRNLTTWPFDVITICNFEVCRNKFLK